MPQAQEEGLDPASGHGMSLVVPANQPKRSWSTLKDRHPGRLSAVGFAVGPVLDPSIRSVGGGPPESSLWTFTYPEFWKQFDKVRQLLRLQIVPYEARHSMPSIDRAEHGRTTVDTQKRGRWLGHKSMLR